MWPFVPQLDMDGAEAFAEELLYQRLGCIWYNQYDRLTQWRLWILFVLRLWSCLVQDVRFDRHAIAVEMAITIHRSENVLDVSTMLSTAKGEQAQPSDNAYLLGLPRSIMCTQ